MEYWSPAPLPERDPGKDAAAPTELRQLAEEVAEFSSDSSVGSEMEVEITRALRPPPSAALRRKMRRVVKKIQLSKAGLAAAQQKLRSSTRKGRAKSGEHRCPRPLLRWARHRPAPMSRRKQPRCWANCAGRRRPRAPALGLRRLCR